MSDEDSAQNQEQPVKNKEEAERKFGCPCGKWYLSYPALFTHVKQKHEGKVNSFSYSLPGNSSNLKLIKHAVVLVSLPMYPFLHLEQRR